MKRAARCETDCTRWAATAIREDANPPPFNENSGGTPIAFRKEMPEPLVPRDELQRAGKVLFITHLALGDFAYLQQCFKALHHEFPGVAIDLWVTDIRSTWRFWRWRTTRQDALYQWLASSPFIHRVYRQSDSLRMFARNFARCISGISSSINSAAPRIAANGAFTSCANACV